MNYEIIPTLGPSSNNPSIWKEMLSAGATAFRLNTSHLSIDQLGDWVERYRQFVDSIEFQPPLVLDLQGSKWRLGKFQPFLLKEDQEISLIQAEESADQNTLPVPHPDFFLAAENSGDEIVLNDAKSRLKIVEKQSNMIRGKVLQGGEIIPRKGITYTNCAFRQESLNQRDQKLFDIASKYPFSRFAISYIKDSIEMEEYRKQMGNKVYLIAKLERPSAFANLEAYIYSANELWVCRGDLGAEVGLRSMAELVYQTAGQVNHLAIPVMMAGQVLEHMTVSPTPTRSEICYLFDALSSGYAGFVLSDEAAVGKYPLESVQAASIFR